MSTYVVESDPLNVEVPLLKVTGYSTKQNKTKQTKQLNYLNQNSDFLELSLLLI